MANKPELRLTDQQRFDWLRLIRSENVGPRTCRALVTNCGGVAAALKALPEIARRGGAKRPIRIASVEEVEKELVAARRFGFSTISGSDLRLLAAFPVACFFSAFSAFPPLAALLFGASFQAIVPPG